jgi:type I restriction enzyme S subunit
MKRFEIDSTEDRVTPLAVAETGLASVEAGSVLFVVRGMILAHSFPVALAASRLTINQDMKALSPKADDPRYVAHLLAGLSKPILALLVEESAHGTRALRMDRWKDFPLFLPPIDEQQEIVQRLENQLSAIDSLLALRNEQAALIAERRATLRSSLVAGHSSGTVVLT